MLGKLFGKVAGGQPTGQKIPDMPALDAALAALLAHIYDIGGFGRLYGYDESPVSADEREGLNALTAEINGILAQVGPLDIPQATSLVLRATELVRWAGYCNRIPNPVGKIENLPLESILTAVFQLDIDRELHDSLLELAAALLNAHLAGGVALTDSIVRLAGRYDETANGEFDAARYVQAYLMEFMAYSDNYVETPKLQDLNTGKRILGAAPKEQIAILFEAFDVMAGLLSGRPATAGGKNNLVEWQDRTYRSKGRLSELIGRLLMHKLPFEEQDLADLYEKIRNAGKKHVTGWPLLYLIGATERFVKANELGEGTLKRHLEIFRKVFTGRMDRDCEKRIERLLAKTENKLLIPYSELGLAITGWVNAQEEPAKKLWLGLMQLGLQTAGKAKPVPKWSGLAEKIVEGIGQDEIIERLNCWLVEPGIAMDGPEPNADILKGMIWAVAKGGDDKLASMLGRLCESCYKKVPGVGPANVKLGNACIYALGEMPGERAVAELVRLRSRIKFNQGRKQLEKSLAEAADRAGLTVADLEEIAVPTFGLDADGSRQVALGDVTAEVRITGSDEVTLSWTGADGKPRKSVPASVKADHADELKALRAEIKEIKGLLAGQRWRLESLYLAQRSWPLADWRKRYLEHPLMANLARRLIWKFGDVVVVPMGSGFIGVDGEAAELAADVSVSLWHPLDSDAAGVLAWRRRLAALEITQPFKQAHREVYLLTDAERETNIYSNRFAAHILRQHQMNALCQARGWRYNLQGAWDQEESVPTLHLPNWRIRVEFWVDYASDDILDSGIYLYRATDQVRFLNEVGDTIPLERVPPMVLSEAMRDVDLFVGVSSVGNDPEWLDRGPDAPFRQYWRDFSFGALGETAKTRKAVLEELLPKLKIADKCEISGKFLKVRGTKRTYKIHLGSGNILMEPNDQYLCIVQEVRGRGKAGSARSDNLRLPFEGDGVLSIILSKAFLLAEDDKITDRTILSQIGR